MHYNTTSIYTVQRVGKRYHKKLDSTEVVILIAGYNSVKQNFLDQQ